MLLQRFTLATSECLSESSEGLNIYLKALQTDGGDEEDDVSNSQIVAISQVTIMTRHIMS